MPNAKPAADTHAYSLTEILKTIELLPGELRGLELKDYTAGELMVQRSIWRKSAGEPKGKRGRGAVPVIP
jgi:hypothetical protein